MTDRGSSSSLGRIAVIGFAATGEAVSRVALSHGASVVVIEDRPREDTEARARALGVELVIGPDEHRLREIIACCSLVVVSPGVPPSHPVYAFTPKDRLISEIELASRLARKPIIAITGTNGKTTVTTMVDQMMRNSKIRSTVAGNIGPTLIDAVERDDLDVIVAEVSSFQLALTKRFHPHVATWLNFAEDHLDWHASLDDYRSSKAKIFANQDASDVAVVHREDPVIVGLARASHARVVTFGREDADYQTIEDRFVGPGGRDLGAIGLLSRALPHDIDNALAALASALEAGADVAGCQQALRAATVLAHRVEHVGVISRVDFYDDSKATTPSAVIAALRSFPSSVLIAGGKNKGLDLSVIRDFVDAHRDHQIRAVVAIGEAAPEVLSIFASGCEAVEATTMDDAVRLAYGYCQPEDVVLLSPGCASFDWYSSYQERGKDFVRAVRALGDAHGTANDRRGVC